MKKFLLFFVIILLSLVLFAKYYNNPKTIIAKLTKNAEIRAGELKYRLYLWGIIPMGEAIFYQEKSEIYKGHDVYHLSASARPSEIWKGLYNASASIDSYIDKQKFLPFAFRQNAIIPGKPNVEKEVFYDQKNHIMSIGGTDRQIPPDTMDPLSVLFNIRRLNLEEKKELEFNINTNQKTYILKGDVTGEKILVNKKTYDTFLIKADIKRRDKNPYHQTGISMVLVKEKENIPILIKVFTSGLLINIRLVEIK